MNKQQESTVHLSYVDDKKPKRKGNKAVLAAKDTFDFMTREGSCK